VTVFNLRTARIRSGEQFREVREVELAPLELGGQNYAPVPERPEATLLITRLSSGRLFELWFSVRLVGPCMRCLADAAVPLELALREYEATSTDGSEELATPYLEDDRLDLSAWARDAVALALPVQIVCREDCAGLCATCGADLNQGPCGCPPPEPDDRWARLEILREAQDL